MITTTITNRRYHKRIVRRLNACSGRYGLWLLQRLSRRNTYRLEQLIVTQKFLDGLRRQYDRGLHND